MGVAYQFSFRRIRIRLSRRRLSSPRYVQGQQPISFLSREFGFDCPGGARLHRDTSRGSSLPVFFRENSDSTVQEEIVSTSTRLGVVAYQFSFEKIWIRLSRRRLSPPRDRAGICVENYMIVSNLKMCETREIEQTPQILHSKFECGLHISVGYIILEDEKR